MKPFLYRGRFIFIPIAIAAFVALTGFVVMNLWNWLIPAIFHLGFIDFWQAVGLFVLSKILFGFGKGGRGMRGGAPWMRHRMEERFKNMTPEEKEKFKEKMMSRCGHGSWGKHNWDDFAAETPKEQV
ncbi:hypothetical protein [Mucilaginibacter sp.]|uniref:hypothetical protein n=1 Tax=Mucilaginibacter sp. TaxID=1882438 RepID=UPI00284A23E1|nr:hypothetical protein [Mucilaginibacter sp.]MDR3693044.1 hypothetical protein [Mucilaginibacter sp.]